MNDQETVSDRVGQEISTILMAGRNSTTLRTVEIGIEASIPTGTAPSPPRPALSITGTNSSSNAAEATTDSDESEDEYNSKNFLSIGLWY